VRDCEECSKFRKQLNKDSKVLAMMFPVGGLIALQGSHRRQARTRWRCHRGSAPPVQVPAPEQARAVGGTAAATGAGAIGAGSAAGIGAVGSAVGAKAWQVS
jgi:hypothetical protein